LNRPNPSGTRAADTVWMWGALLAVNLFAWLQELAGLETCDGRMGVMPVERNRTVGRRSGSVGRLVD
jgi:hypothetical protein